MGIGLFSADNAIHPHPAADLTTMNLRRDAAGHHGERGRLRVRPRQGREINLMRMPVDVHPDEHPPLPDGAEQLIREPFETELRRCCRPLTVMTGGGAENWCTFHMPTAPTPTATTATKGIQTRARTVLPTERGLTRSPFGIRSPTSCSRPPPAYIN